MTLSNWLSLLRIILVPVFMAFLFSDFSYGVLLSAMVFAIAALTDTIDGYLARLRKETSYLGEILDPFADKLLVSAALISLVQLDKLSAWIATLIISREFLVSGLRVVAMGKGEKIPSSMWGKIKTVSQVIAVLVWVILPTYIFSSDGLLNIVADFLMGAAIVLTIYSAIDYFRLALPKIVNENID